MFPWAENTYGQNIFGFPWGKIYPAKALLLASVIELPDFGLLPGAVFAGNTSVEGIKWYQPPP